MRNLQHTPGPWKFALFDDEPNVAFVQLRYGFAAVHGSSVGRVANAHLMAAAPDLLSALREIVDIESQSTDPEIMGVVNRARSAIKKATCSFEVIK